MKEDNPGLQTSMGDNSREIIIKRRGRILGLF